jgi:hypothetical protein
VSTVLCNGFNDALYRCRAYLLCVCPGGYLGVNLAAKHPEVIKGLILLNATPFWSQRPPAGQESLLWQVLNVDSALPVKHVSVGAMTL